MQPIRWTFPGCLAILLVACSSGDPEGASSAAPAAELKEAAGQPAAPQPEPTRREKLRALAAGERTGIWASGEAGCSVGESPVEIMWHFPDVDASRVEVLLSTGATEERVFASGEVTGLQKAGTWVRPGMSFIARDAGTGTELGRTDVPGPTCP